MCLKKYTALLMTIYYQALSFPHFEERAWNQDYLVSSFGKSIEKRVVVARFSHLASLSLKVTLLHLA